MLVLAWITWWLNNLHFFFFSCFFERVMSPARLSCVVESFSWGKKKLVLWREKDFDVKMRGKKGGFSVFEISWTWEKEKKVESWRSFFGCVGRKTWLLFKTRSFFHFLLHLKSFLSPHHTPTRSLSNGETLENNLLIVFHKWAED